MLCLSPWNVCREEMRATGVASVPDPLDILEDLHSPALELSFRAFCELVVRVAAAQNHHMRTLERRVHALITQHIIPALEASGGVPARHPSRARIDAPAMLDAVSQLGDHLFDLFEHIKANRYDALPRVSADDAGSDIAYDVLMGPALSLRRGASSPDKPALRPCLRSRALPRRQASQATRPPAPPLPPPAQGRSPPAPSARSSGAWRPCVSSCCS